jgi:tetratricopeptide (TPR) repeat protein
MSISPKKFLGFLILTAAVTALMLRFLTSEPTVEQLVLQAQTAVERQDAGKAIELTRQILERDSGNAEGLLLAALIAAEQGRFAEAVELCRQVPKENSKSFIDARLMAGNISLDRLGHVADAESCFGEVLALQPDHVIANDRMVYVLGLQSRSSELIAFHLRVLRRSPSAAVRVQLLMQGELAYPDRELIEKLCESDPQCAGLKFSRAHLAFLNKDLPLAETHCRHAIALQSDFAEAQSRLGQILLQTGRDNDVLAWQAALPESVRWHPGVLSVTGHIAAQQGHPDQAARCFWESLRIDPNQVGTNYQLGQCLIALGHPADADEFLRRAATLEKYQKQLDFTDPRGAFAEKDPDKFAEFLVRAKQSMEMANSLGLVWETYSWAVIAAQAPRPPKWSQDVVRTMQKRLDELPITRTLPAMNPAARIDLSHLPLPDFANTQNRSELRSSFPRNSVSFEELSSDRGLRFTFHNGFESPREAQKRAYDFTGGGVGVIDLDLDGWPDLCFPQGCSLTEEGDSDFSGMNDGLFRNLRGKNFEEITQVAMPHQVDYSQGISVGDYNSDGFPDVLIANLGVNRLLRNNGDGTLSQDIDATTDDNGVWTTSCLICDLNADGHPDLYFVNYLSGEILTRICSDADGRRYGRCAPQDFPAEQDQLLLSQGDGTFRDATRSSGVEVPEGKGLGLIAADFNGDRRIDLVIANDGVPNFYFENQTVPQTMEVSFVEQAVTRGLAVNADGHSEAGMGMVAEDMNHDGLLDVFVTNFYEESNTLYRAASGSAMFEDVTSRAGLALPSLKMLGFGAQAIDGELDSRADLVVLNGHVDSYPERDVPYRMVPQYFSNQSELNFAQVSAGSLAPYFAQPRLGRSLARLDWNRDGAEDLVATHLDEPVSLLTNTTAHRGHFIDVRLVATASARDAIGAVLTVATKSSQRVRQSTAGDGYQASNERRLIVGLGAAASIDSVTIAWPSGHIETFAEVPLDSQIILVEGRESPLSMPD